MYILCFSFFVTQIHFKYIQYKNYSLTYVTVLLNSILHSPELRNSIQH